MSKGLAVTATLPDGRVVYFSKVNIQEVLAYEFTAVKFGPAPLSSQERDFVTSRVRNPRAGSVWALDRPTAQRG